MMKKSLAQWNFHSLTHSLISSHSPTHSLTRLSLVHSLTLAHSSLASCTVLLYCTVPREEQDRPLIAQHPAVCALNVQSHRLSKIYRYMHAY
ncbi:hypothetical protein LY76DRAFT_169457 [Colletotrichum caudatum]|nr:hypothetical protein LY76DRAFT_169457 [Colletotrichum caudatum]